MALTLDATLLAAQSSATRKPLCSLIAKRAVDDIPLPRNPGFAPDTYGQVHPSPVVLPSGALAMFYAGRGSAGDYRQIRVIYSDPDRTTWGNYIGVTPVGTSYGTVEAVDAVAMDGAGTVGVVFETASSVIRALIVNATGVATSNVQVLSGTDVRGCSVVKTPAGGYLLYYAYKSGSNYALAMRSSADFITWSAATVLSVGGLTATSEVKDLRVRVLADDSYLMVFSYQDYIDATGSIYNIYFSTSTDGSTWADADPVTDTTLKSRDYSTPDLVQRASGDLFISALEANTYLAIGRSSSGWINNTNGNDVRVWDNWLDSVSGHYYFISHDGDQMNAMVRMNIATWTIDKIFHGQNTPTFPSLYVSTGWNQKGGRCKGAGSLAPLCAQKIGVLLMDFATDSYRAFNFIDGSGTYGPDHAKNVSYTSYYDGQDVAGAWVDLVNNRLYVLLIGDSYFDEYFNCGYIDLSEAGPTYSFTELIRLSDVRKVQVTDFAVYPDDDLLLVWYSSISFGGNLLVFDMSSGAIYKEYTAADYPDFPAAGVNGAVLIGNKIYATACYSPGVYAEEYKYWLLEIDLLTDAMVYHYPTFTTDKLFNNDNSDGESNFGRIYHNAAATELIIDGLPNPVVFNYSTNVWEYVDYNADEGPPTESERWYNIIYDPTTDNYFGSKDSYDSQTYLLPRSGSANRTVYTEGTLTTVWSFTAPELLINGYKNIQAHLTLTADDAIWAFWRDEYVSVANLSWGKTGTQLELSPYLTDEVAVTSRLDGSADELAFRCSHGYLFDPNNRASILNYYLRKGNVAVLQLGDTVSGTNYLANQGSFVIRETALKYRRGEYPTITVRCEDVRCLWDQHEVRTTQVTASYPEDAIKNIVKAHTPLTDDDFNLPTFDGRFTFDATWIDTPLLDILNDIANRWNYFLTVDVDGKLSARKIDTTKAVSNAYADTTKLIDYTPDDSYSDMANQIAVTGQGLVDIEVMYAEERIAGRNGTVGWWGCRKDYRIYYSDDKSRRVKYPRLEIIELSASLGFSLLGGVDIEITEEDTEHKYCVVEIKVPNLIPLLIQGIIQFIHACAIGDMVVSVFYGWTIPVGRLLNGVAIMIITSVLGSLANYQFDIYGQPLGYVKRDYIGTADDTDHQAEIGMVVRQQHEGFLCYLPADCTAVAEQELTLTMLQRNRVTCSKIAHLQDEVGDIISVPHPYTGATVKLMIAEMTRRYRPATAAGDDGYFLDDLETWVVT